MGIGTIPHIIQRRMNAENKEESDATSYSISSSRSEPHLILPPDSPRIVTHATSQSLDGGEEAIELTQKLKLPQTTTKRRHSYHGTFADSDYTNVDAMRFQMELHKQHIDEEEDMKMEIIQEIDEEEFDDHAFGASDTVRHKSPKEEEEKEQRFDFKEKEKIATERVPLYALNMNNLENEEKTNSISSKLIRGFLKKQKKKKKKKKKKKS